MTAVSQWLLIGAAAAVGVLHTIVPDHWLPITVMARQRGWLQGETATAALQAGAGHVLSTLAIALALRTAGGAVAKRFGTGLDALSSVGLIGFGLWIAISSWYEQHRRHGHGHGQDGGGTSTLNNSRKSRMALLLILGSSPTVEAVPVFFAASEFGTGFLVATSMVFAVATMGTYVVLCVASRAGLHRFRLGALESYAETVSGAVIAAIGVAFWIWPVL